ncbi:ergothioneine biosynthesis protein EgtC [Salinisphaera sp.]|uniref:ergothioneine biosynthesis protein EgtC n=1 Tax=Salinisphaera sp. TaxID=1914330 RepID=UPI002D797539|nr:ergothioneine biosynthesis protein EgtC [Salinisphaera sp.]HET7313078.1 ergothioneine biosynthesis protein EgtC [Salinisphaera sp.]
MCRIAAYLGPACPLRDFLDAPPHSLARQSWDAREMASATVNADGWGVGWYADDGQPAIYRHTLPVWADGNVDALGRSLSRPLWVGNVRSATPGLGTDHANTQPFAGNGLIFAHNGYIQHFAHTLRARVRAELDPAIEQTINGNTDSEYLFALVRQQSGSLVERLRATLDLVRAWLAEHDDLKALLNIIVTDGRELAAVRSAFNTPAPSLYIHENWRGGFVIASEAFDTDPGWQAVVPERFVTLRA